MDRSVPQIHRSRVRLQDIVMSPLRTSIPHPYDYRHLAVDQGLIFKNMAKQHRKNAKMLYPSQLPLDSSSFPSKKFFEEKPIS